MLVGQERRLALDEGFGPSAPANTGIDVGRVRAQPVPLYQHDPRQALGVGLGECVAHRQQAVESFGTGLRRLGLPQHHRQSDSPVTAPQQAGQVVEPLHLKPKSGEQALFPPAYRRRCLAPGLTPVRAVGRAVLQFVHRQQALVVEPRQRRLQRRQHLCQEPQRRVAVGLVQHLSAQPLHLPNAGPWIHRWLLAARAAKRCTLGMEHDYEHRSRPPCPPVFRRLQKGRPRRYGTALSHGDFDGMSAVPQEQPCWLQPVACVRRPRPCHEVGEKPGVRPHTSGRLDSYL